MVREHWRHLVRKEKWSLGKESKVCAGVDEDTDRTSEEMASEERKWCFHRLLHWKLFRIGFWSIAYYHLVGTSLHSEKLEKFVLQELTQFYRENILEQHHKTYRKLCFNKISAWPRSTPPSTHWNSDVPGGCCGLESKSSEDPFSTSKTSL